MFNLLKEEEKEIRKLNTPKKIQDFLENLDINFEENKETCMSPRRVLKERKCHCIEAAMFAALALRLQGEKPLILDLTSTKGDWDHVIAIFKKNNKFGAISKTNHAVLGYRDAVYSSIKELVMSFFHEYTDETGKKTLRSYSNPINLSKFDKINWMVSEEDLWEICNYLIEVKHHKILSKKQISDLRNANKLEIIAGNLRKQEKPNRNIFYIPLKNQRSHKN